jgi:predicted nucleotidyltransferase component of viral defense system
MVKENTLNVMEKELGRLLRCDLLPEKTYLAGGTAVYLYLKHRISIDLDFFTHTSFNPDILIAKIRDCVEDVQVELMEKNTVILYLSKEKVKFSLFFYSYDILAGTQTVTLQDGTLCPLASMEDIEAMKALAIYQRGSIKDFVDLYYLVKKTGHRYDDIFNSVKKKYGLDSAYEYHMKTSFVYFADAEKDVDNIFMLRNQQKAEKLTGTEWEKIKMFFKGYIK